MIYAYVLVVVNSVGVVSYSPPVATVNDCNILLKSVTTTSRVPVDAQCVRIELPRGK